MQSGLGKQGELGSVTTPCPIDPHKKHLTVILSYSQPAADFILSTSRGIAAVRLYIPLLIYYLFTSMLAVLELCCLALILRGPWR